MIIHLIKCVRKIKKEPWILSYAKLLIRVRLFVSVKLFLFKLVLINAWMGVNVVMWLFIVGCGLGWVLIGGHIYVGYQRYSRLLGET